MGGATQKSAVIPHSDNHLTITNVPNPNSWMQKADLSGKQNTTTWFWKKKGIYLESTETLLAATDLRILVRFLSPQNINSCSTGKSN